MTKFQNSPRLKPNASQLIDRSKSIEFTFGDESVQAYQGDTVASALYASGLRIFSRSFKYHRPRGLMCVSGKCPNCLVTVDGVPNIRSCTFPVQPGIKVTHQNAWPSLDTDLLSVLDKLNVLMPVGFYYKVFHSPKFMWKLVQPMIRKVAGIGRIDVNGKDESTYSHKNLHTDVAIVGGGLAGMSAALSATKEGVRVTLIDDFPVLGGQSRWDGLSVPDISTGRNKSEFEIGQKLVAEIQHDSAIKVITGSTAFGLYDDNLLGILGSDELIKLRAKQIVLATGTIEQPMLFDQNDLPGVMLASGAQRLASLYGIQPGNEVVVATATNEGYSAALELHRAGVTVTSVVDSRSAAEIGDISTAVANSGIKILKSHVTVRANGKSRVSSVTVQRLEDGLPSGNTLDLPCDLLCLSGAFEPANALMKQASAYGNATVYTTGSVVGVNDLPKIIDHAGKTGSLAARGSDVTSDQDLVAVKLDLPISSGKKSFVCLCEDISASDIRMAIEEGFEDIQTLKRYSTVTMGPCQGKMCHSMLASLSSNITGKTVDAVGSTTSRPPVQPIPLSALAGRIHMPVKRTPLDNKHMELNAKMVDLGPWRRPYSYTTPQQECKAVREGVGIIDVSTLGKIDVRGKSASKLLDKVYTHKFSSLKNGRIRYGILCSDNGTVMDDGTVTRVAEDEYFVTTTTGNVELIEEWFKWWMAGTELDAYVTNVTSNFAAINLAGPKSRHVLSKLTDLDLSSESFPYMSAKFGKVAGVEASLLRIGFVGEMGWELHFPSEYGEHVWEALMDAGQEYDISPFGLEAQRILRLEKGHIIVGQDTDVLSTPFHLGMDWVVRLEKTDFVGRGGLVNVKEQGVREKLVGFTMHDNVVPEDGDPVVDEGKPVGKVTSSRMSPTTGKGFGLVWIPVELATAGNQIAIRVDGSDALGVVTNQPLYDPESTKLRD
ncbi:MAG: FAD-dependent oxidoreductase [Chloroflexota bacterium]|nr:FAD-dependent oxidoreductase [Chloroflexota bacterium]